ncbi:hypothetical protein COU20_03355 [Candidatus Kaiserbacteria bacterium CG10_big_fil_rev_8_21_14_0_10_59_10]|uniref:POTRA domain-containing protein n=1 Tax=Candidatus Kaiserbacteria bacterium CG10_big_fil_rev_8_21_14_0_10_59_10 TaxID=1974612 RepID=A0A2H0U6W9_9BACT|nr:MAG: hypothetical protein COU20_03355 [Candidatus Kaiserbacteria bacterium CG10_big_fil_rev_8_21_14_0_10_59_10]
MPRLAARRRARNALTAALAVVCLLLLGGGGAALTHMERLTIADIQVRGASQLAHAALASRADAELNKEGFHLLSRKNIFLYPRSELESSLRATFPRIRTVSVARDGLLSRTLVVSVEEREPFALWCGRECYVMDRVGYVFAEADGAGTRMATLVFEGGIDEDNGPVVGSVLLPGAFEDVRAMVAALAPSGCKGEKIVVLDDIDYMVECAEGFDVKVSFVSDIEQTARNLALSLSSDALAASVERLEYIDLRFGNRVYYKR